jgi:hypothetical protein
MELGKKRQIARSQWNKEYLFEYVFVIWDLGLGTCLGQMGRGKLPDGIGQERQIRWGLGMEKIFC